MRLLVVLCFLSSVNQFNRSTPLNREIVVRYPNLATGEEAELIRETTSLTGYDYRIKIGKRYISDAYPDITSFQWSPDGKHFYFLVQDYPSFDDFVVQDGKAHYRSFDIIGQIQWSQKSDQLVYFGILNHKSDCWQAIVMWNGIPMQTVSGPMSFLFDESDQLVVEGAVAPSTY